MTPPQKPADFLKPLADQSGFVDVNKHTLKHTKFSNVFALGDCSNLPTSRTAAAVAAQCDIVFRNLSNIINQKGIDLKVTKYYLTHFDKFVNKFRTIRKLIYILCSVRWLYILSIDNI